MCETSTLSPSRDAAGDARYEELVRNVKADITMGLHNLPNALRSWRDEVVNRLPSLRPLHIRIPQIFVDHLALRSQKVIIKSDGSVYEHLGNTERAFLYGPLVPASS